jgi:hypothetical protein
LLSSLVLSANEDAKAACSGSTTNWIEVRFDAPAIGEEPAAYQRLQVRVIEYLQAEYGPREIDVCASRWEGAAAELATLRIGWAARSVAIVQAWTNEGLTQKELSRRLSLEGLPPDAHAMAIAVGASELLGASWMELGLEARSKRSDEIPSSSQHEFGNRDASTMRRGNLAFLLASESFSGGLKQFGLDAQVAVELTRDVDVIAKAGGRSSLSATSGHGSVSASGWLVGLGAELVVVRPAPSIKLALQGRSDLMWVDFLGAAKKGATATSGRGNAWWSSLGIGTDAAVAERVFIDAGVAAGWVFLPIAATDGGRKVIGIEQGLVAAHAGIKILL